uniref:Rad60/SUMO-like domain-containing protein n=1 Tax=Haplochromis burtoni TaxID=8153 RepID=A0A3Q2VKJ7_HAPBU
PSTPTRIIHHTVSLSFSCQTSEELDSDQKKVRFHFDGSKVTGSQTPAQLDMEDEHGRPGGSIWTQMVLKGDVYSV